MPFIRAISDTSPTSQLNVTFLQTSAIEPLRQDAGRSRGQRTAAYNSRNVGICVMLAGSIPVIRFSPSNLLASHRCEPQAAQADQAWATYRSAMNGIDETKAGKRPVSKLRATFLRHPTLQIMRQNVHGHGPASVGVFGGVTSGGVEQGHNSSANSR